MKLTILDLGRCDVDKGRLLAPGVDDGVHVLIPIPAFLIETDDGKRILIDTGMHPVHVEDPDHTFRDMPGLPEILRPVMKPEDTVEHRLRELGLGLEDLTHVVNSHLHFDHCGQNASITHLPIVVDTTRLRSSCRRSRTSTSTGRSSATTSSRARRSSSRACARSRRRATRPTTPRSCST
jgi:N-acyl homoserine lactone hydrolase